MKLNIKNGENSNALCVSNGTDHIPKMSHLHNCIATTRSGTPATGPHSPSHLWSDSQSTLHLTCD